MEIWRDVSPGWHGDTNIAQETLPRPQSQKTKPDNSLNSLSNLTGVDSCRLNPCSGPRKQGWEPFLLKRPGAWKMDINNKENCRETEGRDPGGSGFRLRGGKTESKPQDSFRFKPYFEK